MSEDIGRTHSIVHVADTGYEQGGGTQLLTVGAVRRRHAQHEQRRRRHAAAALHAPGRSAAGPGSVLNNLKSIPEDLSVA